MTNFSRPDISGKFFSRMRQYNLAVLMSLTNNHFAALVKIEKTFSHYDKLSNDNKVKLTRVANITMGELWGIIEGFAHDNPQYAYILENDGGMLPSVQSLGNRFNKRFYDMGIERGHVAYNRFASTVYTMTTEWMDNVPTSYHCIVFANGKAFKSYEMIEMLALRVYHGKLELVKANKIMASLKVEKSPSRKLDRIAYENANAILKIEYK